MGTCIFPLHINDSEQGKAFTAISHQSSQEMVWTVVLVEVVRSSASENEDNDQKSFSNWRSIWWILRINILYQVAMNDVPIKSEDSCHNSGNNIFKYKADVTSTFDHYAPKLMRFLHWSCSTAIPNFKDSLLTDAQFICWKHSIMRMKYSKG